ncbi:MAG: 2-polyprenyl-6-methoxyphenol hydroxylase [Alphaproteobacteria bacterium]|nr:2-polyprenyl-6-methoxyphenol hydroxylase [Alphaproteobacteria bacterium]
MDKTPVLIAGAGPVGLAMAGDLGWRGIDCIVTEQSDGSIHQPRQDLVGIRTMEFCRRWGIASDVAASPYPRDLRQDNIYIAGDLASGWEIGRYAVPAMGDDKPPPQSPQIRERCPQNMFDPVLKKFAQRTPHADLRYRHRVTGFTQHDDRVVADVEQLDTGKRMQIEAQYLIACDGAGSRLRQMLGIEMMGNPALTFTTNVIFRSKALHAINRFGPCYRFILIQQEGTWATIVAIDGRDNWRFSIIRSGNGERNLTEAEVQAAIRRAVGRDFEYEIISIMPWTRRELVAERMCEGRVFIAGDSAHAMSPTGGFGMNTGVGDAVDLSWKIDAMLAGWGGGRLLDSYSTERRPVAERNVREAAGNLGRMLSPAPAPSFLTQTPQGETERKRVGEDFSLAMMREWKTLGIHLGYFYENSPIIIPDGSPAPSLEPAVYEQTSRPGSRAPHVWMKDGRSTLDLFGRTFVLLRLGADAPSASGLIDAAKSRGMPLEVIAMDEPEVIKAYERKLVLVRPDGHSCWRSDEAPADAARVIDIVRGA